MVTLCPYTPRTTSNLPVNMFLNSLKLSYKGFEKFSSYPTKIYRLILLYLLNYFYFIPIVCVVSMVVLNIFCIILVDVPHDENVHVCYQLFYNTHIFLMNFYNTHMCYNVWKINFDYILYVTKIMNEKKIVTQYIHK